MLQECIDLRKVYVPARVVNGKADARVDQTFRVNEVVYLDDVFRPAPDRSDILTLLRQAIWSDECRHLWHTGYYIFDIINYSNWQEMVLSRYGSTEFYKKHKDTRLDAIQKRLVTLVYYLNRVPAQFTGGSLRLFDGDKSLAIEAVHNRAIVFPSFAYHEVEPILMNSQAWEDGRFSINCWLGFI